MKNIIYSNYPEVYEELNISTEEIEIEQDLDWEAFVDDMNRFMSENNRLILVGKFGMLNGKHYGGKVIDNFRTLTSFWNDCDYVEIYDEDGHLYVRGAHHDGSNIAEIKMLTDLGEQIYNRWCDGESNSSKQEIHEMIFNSKFYSKLPRFAHKVYGCRK